MIFDQYPTRLYYQTPDLQRNTRQATATTRHPINGEGAPSRDMANPKYADGAKPDAPVCSLVDIEPVTVFLYQFHSILQGKKK